MNTRFTSSAAAADGATVSTSDESDATHISAPIIAQASAPTSCGFVVPNPIALPIAAMLTDASAQVAPIWRCGSHSNHSPFEYSSVGSPTSELHIATSSRSGRSMSARMGTIAVLPSAAPCKT